MATQSDTINGLNIPGYLKDSLTKASGTINDTFTDVADIMTKAGSASQAEQTAIQSSASAAADAERLITARKLEKESLNKSQAADFGTNKESSSFVLNAMTQSYLAIDRELDQRSAKLQEKLDTKFSTDPIGWITNQFTLPGDVLAFAHRKNDRDSKYKVMKEMLDLSKDAVALNNAIDSGTSMEIAAANERKIMADAMERASKTQLELQKFNLQGANIRRATSMDQVQLVIAANNADAEVQKLQLAREAGWRAQQTLELQKEFKQMQMDEKLDKQAVDAIIQEKLNNVAAITGMQPITTKEYYVASPKARAMYERLMTDPDINEKRLGSNAAEALATSNDYNFPLTPGMNYVRDKLNKIATAAHVNSGLPVGSVPFEKLKPAEQQARVQDLLEKRIKEEAKAIPKEGGVYSPPSLSKTLEIPLVGALSLAKDLKPMASMDRALPTDPDIIFTAAADKIQRGESTPKQMAAELKFMFTAVAMDNNTQRAYKRLVVPLLTEKQGYHMNVYTSKGWRGMETLDFMNLPQLENALMRRAVAVGAQKQGEAEFGVP